MAWPISHQHNTRAIDIMANRGCMHGAASLRHHRDDTHIDVADHARTRQASTLAAATCAPLLG